MQWTYTEEEIENFVGKDFQYLIKDFWDNVFSSPRVILYY